MFELLATMSHGVATLKKNVDRKMTTDKGKKWVLDAVEIASQIPHRYPYLLLDRIVEQSPGRCVAIKNITINECYFQGHFPGMPIMPGTLLAEAMAQAGNFLGTPSSPDPKNQVIIRDAFLLSSEAKFLKPVVPGDQIVITARLISKARDVVRFKSEAHVCNDIVATGKFVALVKENSEP